MSSCGNMLVSASRFSGIFEIEWELRLWCVVILFALASLHPYYDFMQRPDLEDTFKAKFLEICEREKPPRQSTRFIICAKKV